MKKGRAARRNIGLDEAMKKGTVRARVEWREGSTERAYGERVGGKEDKNVVDKEMEKEQW